MQNNRQIDLPLISCGPGEDSFPVLVFVIQLYPIRVCFALKMNKAQGQSFGEKLVAYLREDRFSHGQLYVALAGATHSSNIVVHSELEDRKMKSKVYSEVHFTK